MGNEVDFYEALRQRKKLGGRRPVQTCFLQPQEHAAATLADSLLSPRATYELINKRPLQSKLE